MWLSFSVRIPFVQTGVLKSVSSTIQRDRPSFCIVLLSFHKELKFYEKYYEQALFGELKFV